MGDEIHIGLNYSFVVPGIAIGSRPPNAQAVADAGFRILVLCEPDWQKEQVGEAEGLKIVPCKFNDDAKALQVQATRDIVNCCGAFLALQHFTDSFSQILICCQRGINRSALVAGLTLIRLNDFNYVSSEREWTSEKAISAIRAARPWALRNLAFVRHIQRQAGK